MGALAYSCFLSVQRVSPSLPLPTTPLSPPPTTLQIAILVLLNSDSLLLILSTLATTVTLEARWAMRGQSATTGRVPLTPIRLHTACTSIAPVSALRISSFMATVPLFAASGGERREIIFTDWSSNYSFHNSTDTTIIARLARRPPTLIAATSKHAPRSSGSSFFMLTFYHRSEIYDMMVVMVNKWGFRAHIASVLSVTSTPSVEFIRQAQIGSISWRRNFHSRQRNWIPTFFCITRA